MALRQQPVDILTVAEQLRSTGELEDAGGPLHNTAKRQGSLFRTHRISRTYHRAEVSCTRTDYLTSNIQTKAFDETQDVDDLMQEAEGNCSKSRSRT